MNSAKVGEPSTKMWWQPQPSFLPVALLWPNCPALTGNYRGGNKKRMLRLDGRGLKTKSKAKGKSRLQTSLTKVAKAIVVRKSVGVKPMWVRIPLALPRDTEPELQRPGTCSFVHATCNLCLRLACGLLTCPP